MIEREKGEKSDHPYLLFKVASGGWHLPLHGWWLQHANPYRSTHSIPRRRSRSGVCRMCARGPRLACTLRRLFSSFGGFHAVYINAGSHHRHLTRTPSQSGARKCHIGGVCLFVKIKRIRIIHTEPCCQVQITDITVPVRASASTIQTSFSRTFIYVRTVKNNHLIIK